jgi:FixJ family two-component response regulator
MRATPTFGVLFALELTLTTSSPLVVLIDDDANERKALGRVLRAGGFLVALYASAEEYLASPPAERPVCLLLDVQLEGMSGLDLQEQLSARESTIPVIVITASDDQRTRERAEDAGCIAFLQKPFRGRLLLDVVRSRVLSSAVHSAPKDN